MTARDGTDSAGNRLVVLEARNVTRQFKGFVAIKEVNLKVHEGTIHALIGPNGAGKSTMFNLLTRFLDPTSGQILYEGRDISRLAPAVVAQQGLVRSFQISAVFPHLSVLENVRVALQRGLSTGFHFWRSEKSLTTLHPRAKELLEAVNLEEYAHRLAGELPYGRKRALEIATTLALEPKVMLLDEPLAGMGQEDIERTAALIRRVAYGRTVLMVEHNLSVVAHLSDVITVLRRGEVLAEGPYDVVSRNPQVMEAYMGAAHV